jgi:hypothetical protein
MERKRPLTQPHSVRDLVDLWPSRRDLAEEANVTLHQVNAWIKRGRIPAEHHFDIATAARVRGYKNVTSEIIDRLHIRVKRSKERHQAAAQMVREAAKTAAE